ncbi:nickel transporter [Desulfocarbo indianensis]|nr:nickel transporter [Desulfocarbo indianensis]
MKRLLMAVALALFVASPALAHFQMIYTPEIAMSEGKELDLKLVFTHPFEAGHTMDMAPVKEFYVVSQRGEEGKPQKTDLMSYLKKITWTSLTNSGAAYEAKLPKKVVRSMGDYVFVLVPGPYLEKEEGIYIQQITKVVANVGGMPGNWAEPVGLPTEIVPLDKPYANWTGGVFRGVVLSNGKPVPNADLEVEFMNHPPEAGKNSFQKEGITEAPHDSFVTMGIKTNANGEFTVGIPHAGWWGICALGSGPDKEANGKELSQDAVIWFKAVDMKK